MQAPCLWHLPCRPSTSTEPDLSVVGASEWVDEQTGCRETSLAGCRSPSSTVLCSSCLRCGFLSISEAESFPNPSSCLILCPILSIFFWQKSHLSLEFITVTHTVPTNAPLLGPPATYTHSPSVCQLPISELDPLQHTLVFWGRPWMSIAFCTQAVFWMLFAGSWLGVLLDPLSPPQWHIQLHITHPVHCPQPAALLQSPQWTLGAGSRNNNKPPSKHWVPHYTATDASTVLGRWQSQSLYQVLRMQVTFSTQPKRRASYTTKGIGAIGTFQPRSSDISSQSLPWQPTHRRWVLFQLYN